jgi:anti-sigma factor RsiW
MDHDEASRLLGAYALDALDDTEHCRIEAHLDECTRCRSEISRHRHIVALLGHRELPQEPH